jgi:hypothetical protein
MGLLDFVNKTLKDLNTVTDELNQNNNNDDSIQKKMQEADELGLSDEEKQHIKDDDYEPTDFEEEPDGDETNDDDYYSEDN